MSEAERSDYGVPVTRHRNFGPRVYWTGLDWTEQRVTLDHPELISALSIAKVKEQSHVFTARRQLQAFAIQVAWAQSRAFALTQP